MATKFAAVNTTTDPKNKVVVRLTEKFGGARIEFGQSSVDLWSDGVVIAGSWSMECPGIAGVIYGYRGTIIKRDPWYGASRKWVLRNADGIYEGDFNTRTEAVRTALRMAQRAAFRALNEYEATLASAC